MVLRLPESGVRCAVSAVLWSVSGLMTVSLFLSMAGGDPFRSVVAVAWAAALEGAKILTWRRGGAWRAMALLLVGVTIFSAWGMAMTQIEQSRAGSRSAVLAEVRQGSEYVTTKAQLDAALNSLSALSSRVIPGDYTTGNRDNEAAKKEAQALADQLSGRLIALESVTATGGRTMFEVLAGESAGLLELIVSLALALITEIFALALSGRAVEPRQFEAEKIAKIQQGANKRPGMKPSDDTRKPLLDRGWIAPSLFRHQKATETPLTKKRRTA